MSIPGGSVQVRVDAAALARFETGVVLPWLVRVGTRVMNNSARRVPVDTGYLRSTRALIPDIDRTAVRVAYRARYARWVHDGARGRPGTPFLTDALNEELDRL